MEQKRIRKNVHLKKKNFQRTNKKKKSRKRESEKNHKNISRRRHATIFSFFIYFVRTYTKYPERGEKKTRKEAQVNRNLLLVVQHDVREPNSLTRDPYHFQPAEILWIPPQQFVIPFLIMHTEIFFYRHRHPYLSIFMDTWAKKKYFAEKKNVSQSF